MNRQVLAVATRMAPPDLELRTFDISDLPLFNEDLELEADIFPEPVRALHDALRSTDGVLWVTPEYNYGVPGVLKNVLDWASRPARNSPLIGKPSGVIGAAMGRGGSTRAQHQLRQSLVFTGTPVLPQPEFMLPAAHQYIVDGEIHDRASLDLLEDYLTSFRDWIKRFSA